MLLKILLIGIIAYTSYRWLHRKLHKYVRGAAAKEYHQLKNKQAQQNFEQKKYKGGEYVPFEEIKSKPKK